jgi:glucose/arabinose dehydrogenase
MAPMWASGCPTLAPSGAAFLDGTQWEAWNGALAVAMLKTQKLTIMFMDANGTVTSTFDTLTNGVRLRSPVQGPDGNLYVGTDDGRIWQVTPS